MKNIEIVGSMGEKLVRNFLMQNGCIVEDSLDHYDSQKDFLRDGRLCEVKTLQPYVYKNALSFRKNQLRKCRSVDELYFVSLPPLAAPDYEHGGKIFLVKPDTFECFEYTTKSGLDMVGIPIIQNSVKCIYEMTAAQIQMFKRYLESDYRNITR